MFRTHMTLLKSLYSYNGSLIRNIIPVSTSLQSLSQRNCCDFFLGDVTNNIGMVGRTMEFGLQVLPEIIIQQKGKEFEYKYYNCNYKNNYGYLKTNGVIGIEYKNKTIPLPIKIGCDGLNEKGLTCDLLFFPNSCEWPIITDKIKEKYEKENSIFAGNLLEYILGNCKDVNDVKLILKNKNIWCTELLNHVFTFHLQIFDQNGDGYIIEYINGNNCSTNSIGVMTNEPEYNWHVTNIKQYTTLSSNPTFTDGISTECDEDINFNGQGNGLIGLPGDPTPPSRFIRCYLYKKFIELNEKTKPKTSNDALISASHILNSVDIPKGIVQDKKNYDHTQWINIKDIFNLKMYFRDHDNLNWETFDLKNTLTSLSHGEQKVLKEIDQSINQKLNLMNISDLEL